MSTAHPTSLHELNTLHVVTVDVYFQRSPQRPSGADAARGIDKLDWKVTAYGLVAKTGTTGPDGKITVPLYGGADSTVHIFVAGHSVSQYVIRGPVAVVEAVSTIRGPQRRLRSMGYHLGAGAVDGSAGHATDRAALEFEGDEAMDMQGVSAAAGTVVPPTQVRLAVKAGY